MGRPLAPRFNGAYDMALRIVPAIHAVWVPPHELHSIRSHGPFEGWSVYVAEAECAALPAAPRTLRTSPLLSAAVGRAATWRGSTLDQDQASVSRVILSEIRTLPAEDFGLPAPRDPRLLRIARQLAEHPEDDRDMVTWSHYAGVSPRTVSRRFVAETGASPSPSGVRGPDCFVRWNCWQRRGPSRRSHSGWATKPSAPSSRCSSARLAQRQRAFSAIDCARANASDRSRSRTPFSTGLSMTPMRVRGAPISRCTERSKSWLID